MKYTDLRCDNCGKEFERLSSLIEYRLTTGQLNFFCSHPCYVDSVYFNIKEKSRKASAQWRLARSKELEQKRKRRFKFREMRWLGGCLSCRHAYWRDGTGECIPCRSGTRSKRMMKSSGRK